MDNMSAQPMDIRSMGPTHVCICGSLLWKVDVIFRDYEIAAYMVDMVCALCGTLATAPTLVDMPEDYVPSDEREEEDESESE